MTPSRGHHSDSSLPHKLSSRQMTRRCLKWHRRWNRGSQARDMYTRTTDLGAESILEGRYRGSKFKRMPLDKVAFRHNLQELLLILVG